MSKLAGRPFFKMNGLGNEIVVLDLHGTALTVSAAEARAIARGEGLAYDQMMVLHDPRTRGTDAFVRIYNNDGSEAGACGNGTRCVAWVLMRGDSRKRLLVETVRGVLECRRNGDVEFTVDMGRPRLAWNEIPLRDEFADTRGIELQIGPIDQPLLHTPAVVNMGNPHAIFFVDDIEAHDLARFGPLLENHPIFPERANISLAHVVSRDHIVLKVWERGVGLTQACGTAACAALVAASRRKLTDRKARVTLPGGDLFVEWRESDDHVMMTGPVELEFEAAFDARLFEGMDA
ncbi:MAG: diaminopimelate epimerase [Hyphomicrobiales bacterium]|nr:diaminopimelate epimerase [Hyphomicrobiales bacterium]